MVDFNNMKDFILYLSVFLPKPINQGRNTYLLYSIGCVCHGYTSRFGIPVRGQYDFFTGCFCKTAVTGDAFVT